MMEERRERIVNQIEEKLEKVVESVATKEVITFKTKLLIVIIQQRKNTKINLSEKQQRCYPGVIT